jgi:hypothetical protein
MRGQWGLIFMYARVDPYELNWVENATACSLYWSECSHQRCNHICPGMLWEPAPVPSCLLNNYGSILGPDNIDPRCAAHRSIVTHGARVRCAHRVLYTMQSRNHTLTRTCRGAMSASISLTRFRSRFLFYFWIKPFRRFRNKYHDPHSFFSFFFFRCKHSATNKWDEGVSMR